MMMSAVSWAWSFPEWVQKWRSRVKSGGSVTISSSTQPGSCSQTDLYYGARYIDSRPRLLILYPPFVVDFLLEHGVPAWTWRCFWPEHGGGSPTFLAWAWSYFQPERGAGSNEVSTFQRFGIVGSHCMHELSHHNNYTQIHDCRSILLFIAGSWWSSHFHFSMEFDQLHTGIEMQIMYKCWGMHTYKLSCNYRPKDVHTFHLELVHLLLDRAYCENK